MFRIVNEFPVFFLDKRAYLYIYINDELNIHHADWAFITKEVAMKHRKFIFFAIALLIMFSITSFAETKKLKRIGVNTFAKVRGNIPTAEVMKTIAEKYAGDIKYGFDQVGMGDVYLPFIDQLKTAAFTEKSLAVGERFPWMLFRIGGKVKVWEDVEWAGQKPLDVFALNVAKDDKNYEFFIPKPCGNIALYKVTETKIVPPAVCDLKVNPAKCNINDPVTVDMSGCKYAKSMDVEIFTAQGTKIGSHTFTLDSPKWQTKFDKPGEYVFKAKAWNEEGKASENPCQAKTYVNFPPVCKLWTSCLPCKDYVGKPITFDASGSQDADGQIIKASFEVTDSIGNVIDSFVKNEKPFTWEKVFTKAGTYTISVIVYDDMGASAGGTDPCKITFEVTQKTLFYLVEAGGLLARGTYTGFFFGRVGLLAKLIPDTLDFIVSAGGAVPSQGDPWRFIFMGNAILNLELGQAAYLGGGLGFSTKEQVTNRKGGVDFVGQFGVNVFNNWTSTGSIFAEARLPIFDSERTFDNHYKLLLGFRYIF
jgi:hypothetical protein